MKGFLNHIVEQLDLSNPLALKDKCFVFPSRRASIYFIDLVKKKAANRTIWAPQVMSIEEFVQENCTGLTVVDPIQLLFKLYQTYQRLGSSMEFEVFQQWGQTLLNDFDEIDRYMVDGNLMYKNLHQFDALENVLGPDEEVLAAIKSFQQVIESSANSSLFNTFKGTWAFVGKVYVAFKAELEKLHWAYNGMCYRQLAEELTKGTKNLGYSEVIFAGFNAISKSEEVIFNTLLEQQIGTIYFDADRFYLDNDKEEAGLFLRKYRKKYHKNNRVHWVITDGFNSAKHIEIIGVEQKTAQAKAAAQIIKEKNYAVSSTAVVMADETVLPSLLYALPEEAASVNITMGYPVALSPFANLLQVFLSFQAAVTAPANEKQPFVQRATYRNLVDQPLLQGVMNTHLMALRDGKSTFLAVEQITEALKTAEPAKLSHLQSILTPAKSVTDAIDAAKNVLIEVYFAGKEADAKASFNEGIVHKLVTFLENLKEFIGSIDVKISLAGMERIVRDALKTLSVPFSGEPLAQLQVMGFLESRALDFEKIIITSVNEELLPASGSSNTYIPFGIRKAFKMPTFLEHNSLYAYHFYRLLQRAEHITLIYTTKLSVTGAGERSRFILQLLHNFGNAHPGISIKERNLAPQVPPVVPASEITIVKDQKIREQLKEHFAAFTPQKPLTPTVLLDYVSCTLKYYFRRILKIREPDEPLDKIDARTFGNLYHDVIEAVYKPHIGLELSKEKILAIAKNDLPKSLEEVFSSFNQETGEVQFTKQVIYSLIRIGLENDAGLAPVTIIDLESKLNPITHLLKINDNLTVPIGGKIDRLDKIYVEGQDLYRVIDYKTGHFELKQSNYRYKPLPNEEYIAAYFENPKYKAGFQLLYYALIQKRNHPARNLNGGIVGIKNVGPGVDYLKQTEAPLENDLLNEFETRLVKMIEDILNPDLPFSQTDDLKECTYCSFKTICKKY